MVHSIHPRTIQEVKEKADIVDVISEHIVLKKKGKEFVGICPFHDDTKPSMTVSPSKQFYYCFSCGAGGNSIKFLMEFTRANFSDVVLSLAKKNNINVENLEGPQVEAYKKQLSRKEELYKILRVTKNWFKSQLNNSLGVEAMKYLTSKRKLSNKIINDFELGFAPNSWNDLFNYLSKVEKFQLNLILASGLAISKDNSDKIYDRFRNRLIVPIHDMQGRVVAFGGRSLDGQEPKYLNSPESEVVALFDADIRTFSPLYPSRMILPLLDESFGISYVKAFYSRLSLETNQLQGRATRLFVGPLLASLEQLVGKGPFLQYLQSFRYPLAGEFAFTKDLAMNLRIPCDWGLEIGLLSEVYRNVRTSKIAQVDLGLFDHKHKNIGDSSKEGLQKMCTEILSSVLRGLMEHQAETLTSTQLATLEVLYKRVGEDRVKQFGLDSAVNQLPYDRHEEELSVQKFAKLLRPATEDYLACPTTQQLPSWSRVLSCEDKLQEDLAIAGSKDIKASEKELIKNF